MVVVVVVIVMAEVVVMVMVMVMVTRPPKLLHGAQTRRARMHQMPWIGTTSSRTNTVCARTSPPSVLYSSDRAASTAARHPPCEKPTTEVKGPCLALYSLMASNVSRTPTYSGYRSRRGRSHRMAVVQWGSGFSAWKWCSGCSAGK